LIASWIVHLPLAKLSEKVFAPTRFAGLRLNMSANKRHLPDTILAVPVGVWLKLNNFKETNVVDVEEVAYANAHI
jgi:hypothetical protein